MASFQVWTQCPWITEAGFSSPQKEGTGLFQQHFSPNQANGETEGQNPVHVLTLPVVQKVTLT